MQLTSDMAISLWPWSLYLSLIFHILTSSFKLFKSQWDNSWEGIYEVWNAKPLWVMGRSWVISAISAKWLDDLHPDHGVGCRSSESRTEGSRTEANRVFQFSAPSSGLGTAEEFSLFLSDMFLHAWRCSLRLSCDSTALLVARFCKVRADWMLASLKATSSICATSFPQLLLQMASLLCLMPTLFSFLSEIQQGRWGGSLR